MKKTVDIDYRIPDKLTKKATITHALRSHMLSSSSEGSRYLEIGCDTCLTVVSLKDAFTKLTAIDIDPERISASKKTIDEYCSVDEKSKVYLLRGTSDDIPIDHYDVVLIDAAHDYENVKRDFDNVLSKNTSDRFIVYFHDYGLVNAGVKKFIQSAFDTDEISFCGLQKNWNPMGGPINDWEAVCITVNRKELRHL